MIYRSPHPHVDIPNVSLHEHVLRPADQTPNKPALIEGPTGRIVTYAELRDRSRRLAGALAARGFGKGDVLCIYSPNLPEYAIALYAVSMLGGISTTVNPMYTEEELETLVREAGACMLLTVPPLMENARIAAERTGIREIISMGEAKGTTSFDDLLAEGRQAPEVTIDPEDLCVLPFSSGTTGVNKGVMLTHRNLVANMCQMSVFDYVRDDGILIGLLPFYHIYGMVVALHITLAKGGTVVTMPRFDMAQFLDVLEQYHITVAHLVPPIILALAKHPSVEGRDFSHLELIFSGAAPLSADLARTCGERLDCRVEQGYGLTETSPVTHYNNRASSDTLWSIGPPIPDTECMVIDPETGNPVPTGELGEIWVRGPQVMKGYLNAPQATALSLNDEGWLRTGDIGCVDENGLFRIVDRIKELIKYKGFQVAPAELEAVLLTHPAVSDAAVVPYPDEEAGEVPKAFVVLSQDIPLEDLQTYVAGHVAPHKKIRRIERVDAIPKSASGKILRRVLVEQDRVASAAG